MLRLVVVFALATLVVLAALTAFGSAGGWVAAVVLAAVAAIGMLRCLPQPGLILLLVVVLSASFLGVGRVADRVLSSSCLCRVGQLRHALEGYYSRYHRFPPAFRTDDDGRPKHSWRVRILPYIGEDDLYERYDFNEPWDGPNNRRLASEMPRAFRCPSDPRPLETGITNYVAIVGPDTAWPGARGRRFSEFGEGRTLLLVESFASDINWLEPRDLSVDEFLAELAPKPTFLEWWLRLPPRRWHYSHEPLGRSVSLFTQPCPSWDRICFVVGDLLPEDARALAHVEAPGTSGGYLEALQRRQRLPALVAALPVTDAAIRWGGFFSLLAAAVALLEGVYRLRYAQDEGKRFNEGTQQGGPESVDMPQ